jgi:dTDP-glucose pyrophosphorylase
MVTEQITKKALKEALVNYKVDIEEALMHMDSEVAIIVDDDGRLCGIVTDGDVRRAFLGGANMQTPVSDVMTLSPITLSEKLSREEVLSIMLKKQIRHLPILDKDGRPIGLELLRNQYDNNLIDAAVLMAGGKGTRLRPLTYDCPKPLLKVGKNTILDNVIDGLKNSGINDIAISVNYMGEQIKSHVKDGKSLDLNISYLEEKKALGTAGALSLLEPTPKKSFIVMNADLLTEIDYRALSRFHKDQRNDLSVCVRQVTNKVPYGVISLKDDKLQIDGIQEKPTHTYLVNAGIYMLEPKIIDLVPKNTTFDMVSLINKAMEAGCKIGAFPIFEYWRDIGQHDEMDKAISDLNQKAAKNEQKKTDEVAKCTG